MSGLNLGDRDAIHMPFVVVACKSDLKPGDKVSLRGSDDDAWDKVSACVKWGGSPEDPGESRYYGGEDWSDTEPAWHGVVDPFMEDGPKAKEPFRVFIREGYFSNLSHSFRIEVNDTGGTATCHKVCDIG